MKHPTRRDLIVRWSPPVVLVIALPSHAITSSAPITSRPLRLRAKQTTCAVRPDRHIARVTVCNDETADVLIEQFFWLYTGASDLSPVLPFTIPAGACVKLIATDERRARLSPTPGTTPSSCDLPVVLTGRTLTPVMDPGFRVPQIVSGSYSFYTSRQTG